MGYCTKGLRLDALAAHSSPAAGWTCRDHSGSADGCSNFLPGPAGVNTPWCADRDGAIVVHTENERLPLLNESVRTFTPPLIHRMKTNRCTRTFTTALVLAVLSTWGYSASAPVILPPTNGVVTISISEPQPDAVAAIELAGMAGTDTASAVWADIKDQTYASRSEFFAGLLRLEAKVENQIQTLMDQRSVNKTANSDFVIMQMKSARAHLKSTGEALSKATPETWSRMKDQVGQAWARTQKFYTWGKASATS